jgi:hypothetical protein
MILISQAEEPLAERARNQLKETRERQRFKL